MTEVAMFVYGTLRVDEDGHSWGVRGQRVIRDAVIDGARMWSLHDAFPVVKLIDFYNERDTVIGDIVFYDTNDDYFKHVCDVEIGAGYVTRSVKATDPDGTKHDVIVWHWNRTPRGLTHIRSGNWKAYARGLESELT